MVKAKYHIQLDGYLETVGEKTPTIDEMKQIVEKALTETVFKRTFVKQMFKKIE